MQTKISLFIISVLLLIANIIYAQNMMQTSDHKLSGDVPYVVVGKQKNNTIICMQIDGLYDVKKYTDNMAEWSTIELPCIPNNCKQLFFIKQDTTFLAIYEIKASGTAKFFKQLLDTNFKEIGPALNITNVDIDKYTTGISIEQSENKRRMAFYYINKVDDIGYANYMVMDANTQNPQWYKIALDEMEFSTRMSVEVLNEENIFISILRLNKDELIESIQVYNVKNNEEPKPIKIDLNNENYNYKCVQIKNNDKSVAILLTHAKINSDDKNFIKKIIFNCNTNKVDKNVNIDIQNVANKNNEVGSFANYLPRNILVKNNGDLILVSEYFNVEEVILGTDINATGNTGAPFRISRKMKKYDYSDVLMTAINNSDSILWQKIVHKEQLSENDEGYYSSYGMVILKNKIGIIFNAIDNNNTIQQATIDGDAFINYAILNDNKIEAKNLVFKQTKQISNNEIIVPCIRQNIYSFVKIRL
jgi:hypothetical protein